MILNLIKINSLKYSIVRFFLYLWFIYHVIKLLSEIEILFFGIFKNKLLYIWHKQLVVIIIQYVRKEFIKCHFAYFSSNTNFFYGYTFYTKAHKKLGDNCWTIRTRRKSADHIWVETGKKCQKKKRRVDLSTHSQNVKL